MNSDRNKSVDLMRGILIFLVVLGHSGITETVSDIIYMFHMPLFLVLSGFLIDGEKLKEITYLRKKTVNLLVPYFSYLILDILLIRQEYSIQGFARMLWGGRALNGTYWYTTSFLIALWIFHFLLKRFSDQFVKTIVIFVGGGGIAVVESHILNMVPFLKTPGIPFNADVSLIALVYICIGYYGKSRIKQLINSEDNRVDIITVVMGILLLVLLVFNCKIPFFKLDMKYVYYKELASAIMIPCTFGLILARTAGRIIKLKFLNQIAKILVFLGQMTIPIMYMHIPANTLTSYFSYGSTFYVIVGIGIPVIFVLLFSRIEIVRKLFGLSIA